MPTLNLPSVPRSWNNSRVDLRESSLLLIFLAEESTHKVYVSSLDDSLSLPSRFLWWSTTTCLVTWRSTSTESDVLDVSAGKVLPLIWLRKPSLVLWEILKDSTTARSKSSPRISLSLFKTCPTINNFWPQPFSATRPPAYFWPLFCSWVNYISDRFHFLFVLPNLTNCFSNWREVSWIRENSKTSLLFSSAQVLQLCKNHITRKKLLGHWLVIKQMKIILNVI